MASEGQERFRGTSADDEHVDVVRLTRLLKRIVVLCSAATSTHRRETRAHSKRKRERTATYGEGTATCGRIAAARTRKRRRRRRREWRAAMTALARRCGRGGAALRRCGRTWPQRQVADERAVASCLFAGEA
jgi:hypothetical protein